jgi:hypothetical protein
MKKFFLLFLFLILLKCLSYSQQINLYGYVLDKITNQPIGSATIEILDKTTGARYITTSGSNGTWNSTITKINGERYLPVQFSLEQNYPNPFNPSTKIPFSVSKEGNATLRIFNILGQELDKKSFYLNPGYYSIDWYSKGSTSVLFYSIEMDGIKISKKMMQIEGGNGGLGTLSSLGNINNTIEISKKTLKKSLHDFKILVTRLGYLSDSSNISAENATNINFFIESVHHSLFFIDLHNDLLEATVGMNYNWDDLHTNMQTDIPRMLLGGLDAQIFVVWADPDNGGTNFIKER